jgi:N-acetylmuramoyl-L-alanine amidase
MDRTLLPFPRLLRWWFHVVLAWALVAGLASSAAAAPAAYKSQRMFGADYIDVRDFARKFGLTPSWIVPQKTMRLKNAWTSIEFTVHSTDIELNGVRVFLGEPVVMKGSSLFIGESDAENLLAPILSPSALSARRPIKVIVIDAGHGGDDPGNQNRRLKLSEKTYTLDVSRRLERLLKAQGYKVIMTRKSDRALSLDARAEMVNRARADLFISIHFNGFSRADVAGTETYVMTPRHQRSSPQAERDNQMVSTMYPANNHDRWNAVLGYHVHRALLGRLKSADRGLKRFRYSVLRSVDCPAVLVEAAFLSNDVEGRRVSTTAYRQQIADSISAAVKQIAQLNTTVRARKS